MIDKKNNPIEWAQLIYELTDAHEHLGEQIDEMVGNDDFGAGEK